MSEHIHKAHNVSGLLYHLVCPTKSRCAVTIDEGDAALERICFDISRPYEGMFLKIGDRGGAAGNRNQWGQVKSVAVQGSEGAHYAQRWEARRAVRSPQGYSAAAA